MQKKPYDFKHSALIYIFVVTLAAFALVFICRLRPTPVIESFLSAVKQQYELLVSANPGVLPDISEFISALSVFLYTHYLGLFLGGCAALGGVLALAVRLFKTQRDKLADFCISKIGAAVFAVSLILSMFDGIIGIAAGNFALAFGPAFVFSGIIYVIRNLKVGGFFNLTLVIGILIFFSLPVLLIFLSAMGVVNSLLRRPLSETKQ